ncbi:MAG: MoaD/ThiS family protein [Deltaproteobacteria bacterium]|nr:MoaD/ThiS family protein [Deltaproteobacteria bacterium]
MKVFIKSNFVVPGLGDKESIEFSAPQVTLGDLFEKLAEMAPGQVDYLEPGTGQLNTEDYQIEINGRPFEGLKEGLDYPLQDGDEVSIRIMPIGGG